MNLKLLINYAVDERAWNVCSESCVAYIIKDTMILIFAELFCFCFGDLYAGSATRK